MRLLTFIATDQPEASSRLALDLVEQARRTGHEGMVAGFSALETPPEQTPLGRLAQERGVPFCVLKRRRAFDPGLLGQMETLYSRFQPNVFVSHDMAGLAVYRLARWRPKIWMPFFYGPPARTDSTWAGAIKSRFMRRLERKTIRKADAVVAASDNASETLSEWGVKAEKIIRIPARETPDAYWADTILSAAEEGLKK